MVVGKASAVFNNVVLLSSICLHESVSTYVCVCVCVCQCVCVSVCVCVCVCACMIGS